ncbi:LUD domain-containing protein, partial [Actinospica durhamensis]
MSTTARDEILARIRTALADAPETAPVDRDYLPAHVQTGLTDLLAENLADYRATVHRAAETEIAQVVARLIAEHGDATLAVPEDLPEAWIPREIQPRRDDPPLQPAELETIDAVLTGAALAIAETGTIVLDTGTAQGRRILTLIPDHHICVIHCP